MPYKDPEKQRAAQRAWVQRNQSKINETRRERRNHKRRFVETYKEEHSICTDCGISYPPHILDFDHLSDKEFGICPGTKDKTLLDIINEIAKCEIVCSNCHRHRTYMRHKTK